ADSIFPVCSLWERMRFMVDHLYFAIQLIQANSLFDPFFIDILMQVAKSNVLHGWDNDFHTIEADCLQCSACLIGLIEIMMFRKIFDKRFEHFLLTTVSSQKM